MAFLSDVRHALRLLARSPVFAVTAVASLAFGIAASTTIFTLADALLLAPRAGIRNPAEIVDIGRANNGSGFDNMSHPAFKYIRDHSQTMAGMSAVEFGGGPLSLSDGQTSERVFGTLVSGNYFYVLGTRPALGRFFSPDEDAVPGERPVAVLTHAFWMRRFAGDAGILQKSIRLNNREFAVVGVAEPGFQGTALVGTDLWVPMAMVATVRGRSNAEILDDPRSVWQVAVGRMKPGIGREQARAELNALMAAFKSSEPRANQRHTISVIPTSRVPGPMRLPFLGFLALLFALTGALLAIACSNVAGMLMARATVRRREMATRLAVGASRGRLVWQLLTETVVLFAAAGLVALPLTGWFVDLLEGFVPALPIPINVALLINPRVVVFALAIALVTAGIFGLAPARQALGGDLAPALHGANSTADRRRFRMRNGLVMAQVSLSLMLVATALLFVRTLQNAANVDPGFETANITLASVDVSLSGYREQAAVDLLERFESRLAAIGGVAAVAAGRMIPLQGSSLGLGAIHVPGRVGPSGDDTLDADWNVVSPGYFEAIGMRVVQGRAIDATDRAGAPYVAVVNDTFARTAWPDRPAVGQRFTQDQGPDEPPRTVEVVGVVADAKYRYISEDPTPFVFVPLAQQPMTDMTFFVRHGEGRELGQELRAAIAQVEPAVPVLFLQSFADAVAIGLVPQRLVAWIAGGVGVAGALLAALGLYGLMAFLVAQRTREIAIRMALGASAGDVQGMVTRQAARLGVTGGLVGLALAGGIGSLMQSLLVGVTPVDPVSLGATALLFAVVLAAACWSPARRAAHTDPAVALRSE
jgi:predicted permease